MSVYIAHEQFICHQTVERTQACSEDFHTRVVRALLHTRVFMKFKSSCTVCTVLVVVVFQWIMDAKIICSVLATTILMPEKPSEMH